jgi:hypothetical protein
MPDRVRHDGAPIGVNVARLDRLRELLHFALEVRSQLVGRGPDRLAAAAPRAAFMFLLDARGDTRQ